MNNMKKLGEFITTRKGYAFKSKWFTDYGVPVVKATNFTDDSIDISSTQFVSEDIARQYKEWKIRTGNVVVQTVGSWPSSAASVVGKCIRVPEEANGALLNQNTVILNCKKGLYEDYLYYSLRDRRFSTFIENRARGSANQASITLDDIREFEIFSHDDKHQLEIGRVLRKYDDLIENNKRRIELLEESARQLYKEWFVRFRFPGHEHVRIIDGVPEGWERKALGEVCQLKAGGTFNLDYQGQSFGDIPFIKVRDMNNIGNSIFITESDNWVTEDQCSSFRGRPFPIGTIVFAKIGEALKKNRVRLIAKETLIDNNMMGAIPKPEIIHFSMLYMKLKSFDFGSLSGGAAVPFLSATALAKEPVLIPEKLLSGQFSEISEPIFKKIVNLQRQITKLTRAREILLPKLMSGKIAV